MARQARRDCARRQRGAHRTDRFSLDRCSSRSPGGGGDRASAEDGGRDPQADGRTGRGDHHGVAGRAARSRRPQRSTSTDRVVHLPWTDRNREDRAGARAGRVPVRLRGRADQAGYVGVHGAPHDGTVGGLASGICRVRRGRSADRSGSPQALFGDPVRRDREGAPRSVQHAVADPRGWASQRCEGQGRQLREHRDHHDFQPGDSRCQPGRHIARVPARRGRRGGRGRAPAQEHEGKDR